MIIVNDWKPLTIITNCSILDAATVRDPPPVWVDSFSMSCENLRKTRTYDPLIRTTMFLHEGIRNISFCKNFAEVLNQ